MISNRNPDRYKTYRNLSLIVIKLLNAALARRQQSERKRYILIVPVTENSDQLGWDSDGDIPNLIDNIDR